MPARKSVAPIIIRYDWLTLYIRESLCPRLDIFQEEYLETPNTVSVCLYRACNIWPVLYIYIYTSSVNSELYGNFCLSWTVHIFLRPLYARATWNDAKLIDENRFSVYVRTIFFSLIFSVFYTNSFCVGFFYGIGVCPFSLSFRRVAAICIFFSHSFVRRYIQSRMKRKMKKKSNACTLYVLSSRNCFLLILADFNFID